MAVLVDHVSTSLETTPTIRDDITAVMSLLPWRAGIPGCRDVPAGGNVEMTWQVFGGKKHAV